MSTIGQPVELSFEILHDATGAQILAPTGLRLYVVAPGTQVLEYIPGQVFEPVGGGVIKTTIPGGEINVMGLYGAVVTADNGSSRDIELFVAQGVRANAEILLPFAARREDGSAKTNLTSSAVSLSFHLTTQVTRTVDPLDFVHLFDSFAAPTAFYMVRILATELTGAGTLAYGVDGTDMEVWRHDLVIQDQPYVDFTIKTNPWLDNVSVEIYLDDILVFQGVSDLLGNLAARAPIGTLEARISKPGLVFSTNNFVVAPSEDTVSVEISTAHRVEQTDPPGFCRIDFQLLQANGTPLAGKKIFFTPILGLTGTGAGVVKQPFEITLDPQGRGVMFLIPGIRSVVTLEGTRLYEEFEVPAQPQADLFDLISFEDKGFQSYAAKLQDGIRRSLLP